MCGIAGILDYAGILPDSTDHLKRMLAFIRHRGPDESGIYTDDQVALGSVRLSIIDLSTGQQPQGTPDNKLWIVFNGEIFNYIELREELLASGHVFQTDSDTEVLLHAYQEYGTDCLDRLNGQFVMAIWNAEKKELFIARDRVGIRPLFYTRRGHSFIFGSEIKAIFEFPGIRGEFEPASLSQVFTFWTTLSPNTIFKDIFELPPGHYMKITTGNTEIRPWWRLIYPEEPGGYYRGSFQEASEELRSLLTDAVRLRLRADVPVAAYLSGGLDSSLTTSLIKEVAPGNLQTFSIAFEDDEFDETSFQDEVSGYLNTKHLRFMCTKDDIGLHFPQVVWHAEIPVLRTAPVPMFCLSKHVRENDIKVVITGEGADEMLAGYDIFKEAIIRDFWSRQPDSKYRPLLLNRLYPYLGQFQGRNKTMLKFFFGYKLEETGSPFYSHMLRWKNTSGILNYFSGDLLSSISGSDHLTEASGILDRNFMKWGRLSQAQWLEIVIFMSGYLLSSQGDRVAMANSVEGRYPFLDYRVIEFASALPPDFKMHGLNEKYILKKMMTGKLPERILKRPKQAYRSPIASSFFSGSGQPYFYDLLSENKLRETGLFNPANVQKLLEKTRQSRMVSEIDNMALAGILSTQLLHFQYVDKTHFRFEPKGRIQCHRIIDRTTK